MVSTCCAGCTAMAQMDVATARNGWKTWEQGAQKASDTAGTYWATELSAAYQDAGELDSAVIFSSAAMVLAKEGLRVSDKAGRVHWLHRRMVTERVLAAQLFFLNRYPESITAVKAYMATAEELKLPEEIGAAYNYMGYCYTAMEDLPSALHWSRKAMETMRGIGGGIDLANAYTGLGNILDEMLQHDSAMVYMHKALELHRTLDHPRNHAATLFSTIETLRHLGLVDSVDHYLARVAVLVQQLDQPRSTMNYLNLLGQRAVERGDPHTAITHLLTADSLSVQIEDHRSRHYINRSLALAYAAIGDMRNATERADLGDVELKEDMGLEKVRAVSIAQAKAEQEKELATAAANAEAYRKGRWFAWAVAGGGVLVALLLGILYRQGKRNAARLAAAQDELMKLEKQREAERVRMNVSRDIHDELGGSLSKIALLSDLVQQSTEGTENADRSRSIADHARQVRGALNDVVWAADPSSDHAGALLHHVADRAHRLLDGTGVELQLDLHADDPDRPLGPAFKRDLSMVVKEGLNNALKHARPSLITVRFRLDADRFQLSVMDNGRGMGHSPVDGGNGLANMRERINAHGGALTIHAGEGGTGTVVEASGPLASS